MGTLGREKQDGSGITHDARLNVDAASSLSVTIRGPFSQAVADRILCPCYQYADNRNEVASCPSPRIQV